MPTSILIHRERSWKSLFLKYEIYTDKIRIQPLLFFGKWLEISYQDIEKVEISGPLVVFDMFKKGYFSPKYAFGLRILKNDLADLFRHINIEKKTGFWRQIRITPKDPDEFYRILSTAINNFEK